METWHLLRERQDARRRELVAAIESAHATLTRSRVLYAQAVEMLAAANEMLVKQRDVQSGGTCKRAGARARPRRRGWEERKGMVRRPR